MCSLSFRQRLNTKEVKLKTNNRLLNAKIVGDLDVELAMGKPIFEWNKIPLSKNLDHSNITLNIEDKICRMVFV